MALRGNLKDFSLPDVFQLVTFSRKTGVLRIRRSDDAEGSVWFRDGDVFFAQSNWHREPLGERLVSASKITPSALVRALELRKDEPADGRRLGQILVDEGYITDKVLEAFIQEQIQDTIFDLMRWDEGDFDFEVLPEVVDEDIGLAVSIENVIMEGSRRLEEWNRIKKKVPSMDIVFKMATAPGEGTFEISLKPIEWNLLLLVDGTRSVAELAVHTSRTDFDVARIVYGLFSAGLLEVTADDEVERLRAERAEREARHAAMERELDAERSAREAVRAVETTVAATEAPEAPGEPVPEAPAAPAEPHMPAEEPEFLSADKSAPSAADMAVFEEMMGAVLEAPAAEVEAPAAEVEAPAAVAPAEPESVPEPTEVVAETEAAAGVGIVEAADEEPPAEEVAAEPVDTVEEAEVAEERAGGVAPSVAPATEVVDLLEIYPAVEAVPEVVPEVAEIPVEPTEAAAEEVAADAGIEAPAESEEAEVAPALDSGAAVGGIELEGPGVAEPMSQMGSEPPPISEPSGDLAADLMALGLGETPTEGSLEPGGPAQGGVTDEDLTIAEIEALARGEAPDLAAQDETAEVGAEAPSGAEAVPDFSELMTSLEEEPAEAVEAEPSASGVISTDAYMADITVSDTGVGGGFSGGLNDEITALTGGGAAAGKVRPSASVNRIPGEGEGVVLHRDQMVDRELVQKIIDGIQKL